MSEISIPALIWTMTALAGALAAAYGAWDAHQDIQALGPSEQNGRRVIANAARRSQILRLIIQSMWVWLGVITLVSGGAREFSLAIMILVTTNISLAYLSVADVLDRVKVRRTILDHATAKIKSEQVVQNDRLDALEDNK